jgi:hypothetical protein
MVRSSQSLMEKNTLPTVSLHCSCGKRLYKMSANVVGLRGQIKCDRCGKHYVWLDSPIALAVSSARDGRALIARLEPIPSSSCNADKKDRPTGAKSSFPTRK